ncbi:unnamed protein product [Amoebophrya sp. A120]|nr:unnamed protein product [Amoebophrya sp. A120]|eukprot:GSA120T00018282001.1
MGALIRRKGVDYLVLSLFVIYLAGITARKFYQLVFDEANMPADWATNFMRRYAFQGIAGIFVVIGICIILDVMGYLTGETPWEGMQEYTLGLMAISVVFSLYMWREQSVDAAFCVAMLIFLVGVVFGFLKIFLHALSLYNDSWNIGLMLLLAYVSLIAFYSIQYQRRRRQNEAKGEAIKDKLYDDMLRSFAYTVRYSNTLYYWGMVYWVFQIEEYLEIHLVGWAALLFYYVVLVHVVMGCCREFRENDF